MMLLLLLIRHDDVYAMSLHTAEIHTLRHSHYVISHCYYDVTPYATAMKRPPNICRADSHAQPPLRY